MARKGNPQKRSKQDSGNNSDDDRSDRPAKQTKIDRFFPQGASLNGDDQKAADANADDAGGPDTRSNDQKDQRPPRDLPKLGYTHSGTRALPRVPPASQSVYPRIQPNTSRSASYRSTYPHDDALIKVFSDRFKILLSAAYTFDAFQHDRRPSANSKSDGSSSGGNLDTSQPPLSNINDIFGQICQKLTGRHQFELACQPIARQKLRVVTMCSGTESPLLAMQLLQESLLQNGTTSFQVNHLASAEIEPFKQAYIQRNFEPEILFRDVTDFNKDDDPYTAYGGTAKVPENIHMLIAGSSCIDYSMLNNSRKSFDQDDSQSKKTMLGVQAYAKKVRPAIVILENVNTAPWTQIRKFWEKANYFPVAMSLDSKNYYIPQTRMRGYMVLFEQDRARAIGLDLPKAAAQYEKTLLDLAQRATSPYSSFIMSEDDPKLNLAKHTYKVANWNNVKWENCRVRYAGFRVEHKLGNARPMTHWKNGGISQFMDYGWMKWASYQRERILDTLDINLLSYMAIREYDMTHKARFVELSQNVDRDTDSRDWGIVGCITPSGMPFDTLRGGPVLGVEALALQGIPIDKLILNTETSRQLQDLAGNAMTTTVIGSVIFSAIVASCKNISHKDKTPDSEIISMFQDFGITDTPGSSAPTVVAQASPGLSFEEIVQLPQYKSLVEQQVQSYNQHIKLNDLLALAAATLPLCGCDSLSKVSNKSFFTCKQCKHTACKTCYGNPIHSYITIGDKTLSKRKDPRQFISKIREALPPKLKMQMLATAKEDVLKLLQSARVYNDHEAHRDNFKPMVLKTEDSEDYQTAVLRALNSEVFFSSVKRDSAWRVIFESKDARVELRISADSSIDGLTGAVAWNEHVKCVWLLYAKPKPDVPSGSVLRDLLSRPIARMTPKGEIMNGTWQVWNPCVQYVKLEIKGTGRLQPSWEQKLGLQDDIYRNLEAFSYLSIQEAADGNHDLTPTQRQTVQERICGNFEWLENCGTACGSLYKRKTPFLSGKDSPSSHVDTTYFFLDPNPLQNACLDRMVFATTHHRRPYGVDRNTIAETEKRWRPNSLTLSLSKDSVATTLYCRLIDQWQESSFIDFDHASSQSSLTLRTPENIPGSIETCATTVPVLVCKLPTDKIRQTQWKTGESYAFSLVEKPAALKDFQWLLQHLSMGLLCTTGGIQVEDDTAICDTCAPQPPSLEWGHTINTTGKVTITKPFEDDIEATEYEKALRRRPTAVSAEVYVSAPTTTLVVNINLATAVHRLCAKLSSSTGMQISWRLMKDDGLEVQPSFPKLDLPRHRDNAAIWPSGDPLYLNLQNAVKPRQFSTRNLWVAQRVALSWMLSVEKGVPWKEWEAQVSKIPALGLQLVVEATNDVAVRGGIVADEVGAGKTTTALALVARSLEDSSQSIYQPAVVNGKITSKATLILVPPNIMHQWTKEIENCFGQRGISVVVMREKNNRSAVQAVSNADIVLAPWTIFGQEEYWDLVGNVGCAPFAPRKAGRGLHKWFESVRQDLGDVVSFCGPDMPEGKFEEYRGKHGPSIAGKYLKNYIAFQRKNTKAEGKKHLATVTKELANDAHFPRQVKQDRKAGDAEVKELLKWKAGKNMPALLHLFQFTRVIVDEFTYLDARTLLAVETLQTKYAWMLSGTPPLSNPESVDAMAKLIGTRISSKSDRNFGFAFKNAKWLLREDKSYAEEFREHIELQIPEWHAMRNERARTFTNTFLRQNPAPTANTAIVEHFVVSDQSAIEASIYHKVFQRLEGSPLRFGAKAGPNEPELDRILQESKSMDEAILTCHARFLNLVLKQVLGGSDLAIFRGLVGGSQRQVSDLMMEILKQLQESFWFWNDGPSRSDNEDDIPHFATFLYLVASGAWGDPAVTDTMSRLVSYARNNRVQPTHSYGKPKQRNTPRPSYDLSMYAKGDARRKELQNRATELNESTLKLIELVKELRRTTAILSIITNRRQSRCDVCKRHFDFAELKLLGHCGHVICNTCLEAESESNSTLTCPVDGCLASSKNCRTPATLYEQQPNFFTSKFTTQVEAVVTALQALGKGEEALVFVQFDAHLTLLLQALHHHQIGFLDGTKSAAAVSQFQNGHVPNVRALILKIDSADSAGWNLQRANHVMFLHPFLAKTSYEYESTMTQAIGRAHRFGQRRTVHVHQFLLVRTMDVNIVQARRGRKLVKRGGN